MAGNGSGLANYQGNSMSGVQLPLGEIASIFVGLPTKASETREAGRSGNVLTVRNLDGTGLDLDNLTEVDISDRDVEKYRVQSGDLLVSSRSTSLRTAIAPHAAEGLLINATLLGVRSTTILTRLLAAWFESPEGLLELENVSQSGTHQMNITVSGLERVMIPIPDLDTQKQMVELLETADEAYRSAIVAAENRRRISREVIVRQLRGGQL